MNLRRKPRDGKIVVEATEKDQIDVLRDSLTEAWLRHHLLSRFTRFILVILISFLAATTFVQSSERSRCEATKPVVQSYVKFLQTAKSNAEDRLARGTTPNPDLDQKSIDEYTNQLNLLMPGTTVNCNNEYPIFPILN